MLELARSEIGQSKANQRISESRFTHHVSRPPAQPPLTAVECDAWIIWQQLLEVIDHFAERVGVFLDGGRPTMLEPRRKERAPGSLRRPAGCPAAGGYRPLPAGYRDFALGLPWP